VPVLIPVTRPDELIVATAGVLVFHIPPLVASEYSPVPPRGTDEGPTMGAGSGSTVKL